MDIIADLHVHSKYSRATARNLDLENIHISAQIKGIDVVATGDFTHPAWWAEISEKLVPAEEGLFALAPQIARACDERVPPACRRPVRFMLVTEISNIYKKADRTRKNHNLVFMPDLPSAERLNRRLDAVGNIGADGRPILGLDARHLLEMVLETDDRGFLVPAHIWTPWFSLLGSKSGFDAVADCFEDLTPHIFALETGLSSDPPMNRRVSSLDRFTLISNSDAHSPAKLGREANRFATTLSFNALRAAMEKQDSGGFKGTIEFYPQEGKYHVDGHRNCRFSCLPAETRALNNTCPVCGGPLVVGVLNRVEQLADRPADAATAADQAFCSLIPLREVLAEVLRCGAGSKTVGNAYWKLIGHFGSELGILETIDTALLARSGVPFLAEAIGRMRSGRVHFDPGFDGAYGAVRIFETAEWHALSGQQSLFACATELPPADEMPPTPRTHQAPAETAAPATTTQTQPAVSQRPMRLNRQQQSAVNHPGGPLLIVAGPGTGKTRTITCRMAALSANSAVLADRILAVTFTQKAAREMASRMAAMGSADTPQPTVGTFHALCRQWLQQRSPATPVAIVDDAGRQDVMADARRLAAAEGHAVRLSLQRALALVARAKQKLLGPEDDLRVLVAADDPCCEFKRLYRYYQRLLEDQQRIDFEGLVQRTVDILRRDPEWHAALQRRFTHIFVDEFQDLNEGQYTLMRLLAPDQGDICVIGDPDQAIYGFRGADAGLFDRFMADYPTARRIDLTWNYRCPRTILDAAQQVMAARPEDGPTRERSPMQPAVEGGSVIEFMEAASPRAEAVAVGKTIEQLVGGTGFQAIDFGAVSGNGGSGHNRSFADIAVLMRTVEQVRLMAEVLTAAGIPCQTVSKENLLQRPAVAELMALLRLMADQGTYGDLDHLTDLVAPAVGAKTLAAFKLWAQGHRLPLAQALQSATRLPIPTLSRARQHRLVALIHCIKGLAEAVQGPSVAAAIRHVVAHTHLLHRIDPLDLQTVLSLVADNGRDLQEVCTALASWSDTDLYRPEAEKVAVMTMHAAKGLEFPVVFIAGCEEGLLPYRHPRDRGQASDVAEERRLFYVAMTRARERLCLSRARYRNRGGRNRATRPTPFLDDIPSRLLYSDRVPVKRPPPRQLTLF